VALLPRGYRGFTFTMAQWMGPLFSRVPAGPAGSGALNCATGCMFDVVSDPGERYNLDAAHPDILSRMTARLFEVNQGLW
jgi:hypothetical protein